MKAFKTKKKPDIFQSLSQLGFSDYRSYLDSSLWAQIRSRVYARDCHKCQACLQKATCVHHRSYRLPVMRGDRCAMLISLCDQCHEYVEFDSGQKLFDERKKELLLNERMLTCRSISLKHWALHNVDAKPVAVPSMPDSSSSEQIDYKEDATSRLDALLIERNKQATRLIGTTSITFDAWLGACQTAGIDKARAHKSWFKRSKWIGCAWWEDQQKIIAFKALEQVVDEMSRFTGITKCSDVNPDTQGIRNREKVIDNLRAANKKLRDRVDYLESLLAEIGTFAARIEGNKSRQVFGD